MKLITIYNAHNRIEIHNSIWGRETITVNDKVVSSKFSFFGATHKFTVSENDQDVSYSAKIRFGFGLVVDIFRAGEPILEFPKYGAWRFVLMIIVATIILKLLNDLI